MSVIPLDVQRRCEQRWAARFARQTPGPSSQKSENEKQGQPLGTPAKPKGGSILRSSDAEAKILSRDSQPAPKDK